VRPVNAAVEGKRYPEVAFVVDHARVEAFRAVFPDDAGGVPPTFLTVAEFSLFPTIVADPELDLDFSRVLHGDQEYGWERPIAVGESLVARARIASIRHRGAIGFLTIETEIVDREGRLVARCRSTMIERGDA